MYPLLGDAMGTWLRTFAERSFPSRDELLVHYSLQHDSSHASPKSFCGYAMLWFEPWDEDNRAPTCIICAAMWPP